jgi:hypothetical protein
MDEPVVLRSLNSRGDAEVLLELLEASGIEAFIQADDLGSEGPSLQLSQGVQLRVSSSDLERAEAIIADAEENPFPEGEENLPRDGEENPPSEK